MTALMVQSLTGNDPEMLSHLGAVVRTFREVQTWGLYPSSGAHRAARGSTARCFTVVLGRRMAFRPTVGSARRARRRCGGSGVAAMFRWPTIATGALCILVAALPPRADTTGGTEPLLSLGSWPTASLTSLACGRTSPSGAGSTARMPSTPAAARLDGGAPSESRSPGNSWRRSLPTGEIAAGSVASRPTTSITLSRSRRAVHTRSATCGRSAGRATARNGTGGRIHRRRRLAA